MLPQTKDAVNIAYRMLHHRYIFGLTDEHCAALAHLIEVATRGEKVPQRVDKTAGAKLAPGRDWESGKPKWMEGVA